ncbi:hypothetical protein COU74_03620 [Candidatus Peregrinibacteria bacterium CG10_big_fil_rev_8_21_14_0_10_36_19]|nr:MAG: hypothetical protein COU74_03620 [Candidatus Peregrinibacteria bacterium CG10_big_fil_rev_8_21_14_0_10_36_19]
MTYNRYISIIASSGGFAWIAWFLVINKLSPFVSTGVSMTFFFLTLFIALTCTFTILGFYFRVWLFKNEIFYQHINVAFRQGFFLSLIVNVCLLLQILRSLNWWTGIFLILGSVLLESYFSSKDSEFIE